MEVIAHCWSVGVKYSQHQLSVAVRLPMCLKLVVGRIPWHQWSVGERTPSGKRQARMPHHRPSVRG